MSDPQRNVMDIFLFGEQSGVPKRLEFRMSMFKSLQNMKGTITVFNKPGASIAPLLKKLEFNQPDKNGEYKYDIDVSQNTPTPEQFQYFRDNCLHTHPVCKASFKHAYPELTHDINLIKNLQSIESGKDGIKFVTPLIVDWDHKLMAFDEKSLSKIIDQYNGNDED